MIYGVVLAGGIGSRMGNVEKPKQFLHIGKKPIIVHTVEKFCVNSKIDKVIVLCPEKWISYTKDILKKCNCEVTDTEGLIDYAVAIKDVDIALCLCEHSSNTYKVSFRSKNADVSIVASMFGGGGHKEAAGFTIPYINSSVFIKWI